MRLIILFLACGLAYAQLDTNTLTITASRNVSVIADQVVYHVSLMADVSATLDEVVGQLAGIGIAAGNLSYVSNTGRPQALVDWSFELVTPFSKMKDTVAALSRVAQKLGSAAFAFSVQTQRVSQDAQTQACTLTSLVSDARREAERIASAAGLRLGGIVRLSDGSDSVVPTAANRSGSFAAVFDPSTGSPIGGSLFSSFLLGLVYAAPNPNSCSLVVQFRLLP